MNSYLFTLAIGVEDRQRRWGSVSGNYLNLARSLMRMGHHVVFAIHPEVRRRSEFSAFECHSIADQAALQALLIGQAYTHAFIWGGRLEADREVRALLEAHGTQVLLSELGWFPQAGTVYFDPQGTNAEVSFNNHLYPDCSAAQKKIFKRRRREFYRKKAGLGFFSAAPPFSIQIPDLRKPILVPLQDEGDTNITLASPFKRMSDFIDCLAQTYPYYQFVVRPHPSAPLAGLPQYANVRYQPTAENVYLSMADFGLVIGINSTLLLEAAMMNMPVVAFGKGIATGTGVLYEADVDNLPKGFESIRIDSQRAEAYLAFLISQRQLLKKDLRSIRRVRNSYLTELLGL
jgi:hypothetical protein